MLLAPAALACAASFEERTVGGQPAFFVTAQLFLFRRGGRANAPMNEVAKSMSDDDLRAFSEWVSKLPPPAPPPDAPDPARLARGQALARRHPCGVCHNPDFSGREQMPRLAYQREEYLLRRPQRRGLARSRSLLRAPAALIPSPT